MAIDIKTPIEFEWDSGNIDKNSLKHDVSSCEAEEVLINKPLLIANAIHSTENEKRFYAFGRTLKGRKISISFTVRKDRVRVIMARDMSKKERTWYETQET